MVDIIITEQINLDELTVSESFADKVLNTSLNGIYIYDIRQKRHVFVNRQYTLLTGYTLEELKAMNEAQFFDLFHPNDSQRVSVHMARLISGSDEFLEIEYRFKTRDGRWIWCLSRDSVFARTPEGSAFQIIGTFLDITERKKSEQMLRESEKCYRELVQNANSAIVRWRHDGTITFFNEYAQDFFGYCNEEIIGRHVNILLPQQESDGDDLASLLQDIVDHPQRYVNHTNENICRDGRHVWMVWTNRAIFDQNGNVAEVLAVGSDITEKKRAEEALRESEEKFSKAFYASPSFLFICELETGVFVDVNDAYCALTGYTREEMIGHSSLELGIKSAQSRFGILQNIRKAGRVQNMEFELIAKSGEVKSCLLSAESMKYRGRRCLVYSGIDLTERKRAEETIQSIARFPAENPNPVLRVSAEGQLLYANLASQPLLNLWGTQVGKNLPAELCETVEEVLAGGRSKEEEVICGRMIFHFCYTPVLVGRYVNLYGRDVTVRKQAEEALQEINQELTEYAHALTHKIKEPLRAIQNYAEFLVEDLGEKLHGPPKKYLEGLRKAVFQNNLQVEGLEALYRIKNYSLSLEPVDMGKLVQEIKSQIKSTPERKLSFAQRWPSFRSEKSLLYQILMELIRNGLNFNHSKIKQVEVGWRQSAYDRAEIWVRDNGIGIEPRYQGQIFQIFRRLHTNHEYEGTGIGLAIVKKAVQKLGGSVRVESVVGKGSTFYVGLPRSISEDEFSRH